MVYSQSTYLGTSRTGALAQLVYTSGPWTVFLQNNTLIFVVYFSFLGIPRGFLRGLALGAFKFRDLLFAQ